MENLFNVKVETLTPETEADQRLLDGVKCVGFVLVAMQDGGATTVIHHTSVNEIAKAFAVNDDLTAASIVANGYREAAKYQRKRKLGDLAKLLGSLGEDED